MAADPTWYLLYGGSSEDGAGPGRYVGRTTDYQVALVHMREVSSDPYSTGHVDVVADESFTRCRSLQDFARKAATGGPGVMITRIEVIDAPKDRRDV